ncbi:MAG: hypothetical protein HQ549_01645 [Candidatus Omnitrophica bacterium]|nr:hypothetical protein [Candidatus Omnitrophota bacterium]
MLNRIREYSHNNKTTLKIFMVYFFLTFVIGYIDFDRRVFTFEQSTEKLKNIITGEVGAPLGRRILIPYTVDLFHKVTHIPLTYSYAFFRFIFFLLAFILFHIYLKMWFDDKRAMIGTLSVIASLPLFLTNWYCISSDMPNFIAFILGMMWIKKNQYKLLYILIPIATFNKEATLALVLLYFLYGIGREKPLILIRRTIIYGLLWAIPFGIMIAMVGFEKFSNFVTLEHNVAGLLHVFKNPNPYNHYYFLLYLCGFYWILAFMDFHKKDPLLKRSVIVMILYFLYVFIRVSAINETRIFMPFYVFVIPLGLSSLFTEGKKRVKQNA